MQKEILCDSSALISLTDSCIARTFQYLAEKFKITFMISDTIEYECVSHPLSMSSHEYAFSALRLKSMIETGVLKKITTNSTFTSKKNEILNLSNNIFFAQGKPLTLVQAGEAELLAIAHTLKIKNLLMDERTTRLLIEAPLSIQEHFEKEFHTNIMVNKENLDKFSDYVRGVEVFRSAELLSLAYSHGYFDNYNRLKKDAYSAALYHLKYSGCSIRYDEIEELSRIE